MKKWIMTLASVVLLAAAVPAVQANWFQNNMDPYPGYYHPSYYFPGAPYLPYPQAYYGGYGLDNCYAGYYPAWYANPAAWAGQAGYACPPNVQVRYETREVTCSRPEWKAERVEITVPRVHYRAEITNVKTVAWVSKVFDEKRPCVDYVPVPRQIERAVVTYRYEPCVHVDPCTGGCQIGCQVIPQVSKVTCTVFDYQPRVREVVAQVCRMVPQEQVVPQTRFIPEVTQEKSWTVRYQCTMVPHKTTVSVPVYTVCP